MGSFFNLNLNHVFNVQNNSLAVIGRTRLKHSYLFKILLSQFKKTPGYTLLRWVVGLQKPTMFPDTLDFRLNIARFKIASDRLKTDSSKQPAFLNVIPVSSPALRAEDTVDTEE